MKNDDITALIECRNILINGHGRLDGLRNPGTAVMLQKDAAHILEASIRKLDAVLAQYVKIESKK
jgi:hypothetical protein